MLLWNALRLRAVSVCHDLRRPRSDAPPITQSLGKRRSGRENGKGSGEIGSRMSGCGSSS